MKPSMLSNIITSVDDHTSKRESRACGMLSGCVISEIKDWLAEMEAKYKRYIIHRYIYII